MSTGGGNKGSSNSNPNYHNPSSPNPDRHPRTSGGENPHSPSPQRPRPMSVLLRQGLSPISPGQSAFTPVNRPQTPPVPQWPLLQGPTGSGPGYGFPGQFAFFPEGMAAAAPVPVGRGGSGSAGGGVRIGGQDSPAARKRSRDKEALTASGGSDAGDGSRGNRKKCSVCQKLFASEKALFGHLRSHPGRGWKGAHPPPTFKVEEEFADVPGVNLPVAMAVQDAGEAGGVEEGGDGAVAEGREAGEAERAAEEAAVAAAEQRRGIRIDLNIDMERDGPDAPDA